MRQATLLAALGLLSVSTAADAYQSVGSHIRRSTDAPRNLNDWDAASGERAANAFARCVADRRSPVARRVLALPFGSREQNEQATRVIGGYEECMDGIGLQLRADGAMIIGGMAEHYIRVIYPDDYVDAVSGLTDEDVAAAGVEPRNSAEVLGLCVARRDPRAVKAFVSTEPLTDEENAALDAVVPSLGPCIPQGETVSLDRRTIRAFVAAGLYRAFTAVEARISNEGAAADGGVQ